MSSSLNNGAANVLSEKDVNTDMSGMNMDAGVVGDEKDLKSMEYHRQVLASKMAASKGEGDNYVSPSDAIMSPCSSKLTAYKNKQFGKAKPQSLFAKTSSKNLAAQGGPMFGDKAPVEKK